MQISGTAIFKAPYRSIENTALYRFIDFFKYELIKILIFLLVFFSSIIFVNSESKEYYSKVQSTVAK